jgi:hypothetical protein
MAPPKFNRSQIAKALRGADGMVAKAAAALGTDRQTIHERIGRSVELQAVLRETGDNLKDMARGTIYAALKAGDAQMARWYAERKMRDEGYGTKLEMVVDTAQLERLAEAIARGGIGTLRAVKAALADLRP